MSIHNNYLKLTDKEREYVDDTMRSMFKHARLFAGVQLANDDRAERAAEALATWLIESRDLTK